MADVWFYHLEGVGLDRVLPELLEKTLEKGWRAVVHGGVAERVDELDKLLWTYRDDAFLPHGLATDKEADRYPIALAKDARTPNGADVLFLLDGAMRDELDSYKRCILVFDGRDQEAVAEARRTWKQVKEDGHEASYWRRNPGGGWSKQA
ncbi:MAG: DNA polymerase III subunit chi [Pseudomonadota bacterium]